MPRPNAAMIALLLALAASTPSRAVAQTYQVDPAHTSVVFSVSHMGFSFTYGMFDKAEGAVTLSDDPKECSFAMTIEVGSIDTGNADRDKHLLNPDFFHAEKNPQITFKSESVTIGSDDEGRTLYEATGPMTMCGVTNKVTLPIALVGQGSDPWGGERVGFVCQTVVDRTSFGMTGGVDAIGKEVSVVVSFEALPPKSE
ncbi:hypothetical protein Mal64_25260 [Pseudobythopirellula maris]|uniref:Lipid/polyisoprenoid-binding YceI-like domain-containing protein n=1 Tax=Pseudobythopirellula maris TaxID=2527991 RepID=A0A5C5ZPI8_9BACT|nr:YceI family protein [Pseudobythopirellula maris]TWT89035.1 hypothetical protein Mal64_25260 [Pseudobythopirellula maris]